MVPGGHVLADILPPERLIVSGVAFDVLRVDADFEIGTVGQGIIDDALNGTNLREIEAGS